MIAANGFHSFAFIDPSWGVVTMVDMNAGKKTAAISYDEFDPPKAK